MIGFFQFFPDQPHFSPGVHLIFTKGWSIIRFVELSAFQNMLPDHIMHIMWSIFYGTTRPIRSILRRCSKPVVMM